MLTTISFELYGVKASWTDSSFSDLRELQMPATLLDEGLRRILAEAMRHGSAAAMEVLEGDSMRDLFVEQPQLIVFGEKTFMDRVDPLSPDGQRLALTLNGFSRSVERDLPVGDYFRNMLPRLAHELVSKVPREQRAAILQRAALAFSSPLAADPWPEPRWPQPGTEAEKAMVSAFDPDELRDVLFYEDEDTGWTERSFVYYPSTYPDEWNEDQRHTWFVATNPALSMELAERLSNRPWALAQNPLVGAWLVTAPEHSAFLRALPVGGTALFGVLFRRRLMQRLRRHLGAFAGHKIGETPAEKRLGDSLGKFAQEMANLVSSFPHTYTPGKIVDAMVAYQNAFSERLNLGTPPAAWNLDGIPLYEAIG